MAGDRNVSPKASTNERAWADEVPNAPLIRLRREDVDDDARQFRRAEAIVGDRSSSVRPAAVPADRPKFDVVFEDGALADLRQLTPADQERAVFALRALVYGQQGSGGPIVHGTWQSAPFATRTPSPAETVRLTFSRQLDNEMIARNTPTNRLARAHTSIEPVRGVLADFARLPAEEITGVLDVLHDIAAVPGGGTGLNRLAGLGLLPKVTVPGSDRQVYAVPIGVDHALVFRRWPTLYAATQATYDKDESPLELDRPPGRPAIEILAVTDDLDFNLAVRDRPSEAAERIAAARGEVAPALPVEVRAADPGSIAAQVEFQAGLHRIVRTWERVADHAEAAEKAAGVKAARRSHIVKLHGEHFKPLRDQLQQRITPVAQGEIVYKTVGGRKSPTGHAAVHIAAIRTEPDPDHIYLAQRLSLIETNQHRQRVVRVATRPPAPHVNGRAQALQPPARTAAAESAAAQHVPGADPTNLDARRRYDIYPPGTEFAAQLNALPAELRQRVAGEIRALAASGPDLSRDIDHPVFPATSPAAGPPAQVPGLRSRPIDTPQGTFHLVYGVTHPTVARIRRGELVTGYGEVVSVQPQMLSEADPYRFFAIAARTFTRDVWQLGHQRGDEALKRQAQALFATVKDDAISADRRLAFLDAVREVAKSTNDPTLLADGKLLHRRFHPDLAEYREAAKISQAALQTAPTTIDGSLDPDSRPGIALYDIAPHNDPDAQDRLSEQLRKRSQDYLSGLEGNRRMSLRDAWGADNHLVDTEHHIRLRPHTTNRNPDAPSMMVTLTHRAERPDQMQVHMEGQRPIAVKLDTMDASLSRTVVGPRLAMRPAPDASQTAHQATQKGTDPRDIAWPPEDDRQWLDWRIARKDQPALAFWAPHDKVAGFLDEVAAKLASAERTDSDTQLAERLHDQRGGRKDRESKKASRTYQPLSPAVAELWNNPNLDAATWQRTIGNREIDAIRNPAPTTGNPHLDRARKLIADHQASARRSAAALRSTTGNVQPRPAISSPANAPTDHGRRQTEATRASTMRR
ncbi:hypothetical protein GCM10009733_021040 [Nonomuraea maheshkhaliensis]|uniref:Uncharacterized protein n=1 Tax=Nonomuraea maheshkhaliensis TaxID=419590 RepID=A0ABN2EZV6_9ACTN